jgi:hypothetical protein
VESFARQIRADLRLTQEYATSGKKPSSGCGTLNGYQFTVMEGTTPQQYEIRAFCSGSAYATAEKTELVPENLVIRANGGSGDTVLFNILGRGTDVPSGNPLLIDVGQAPSFLNSVQVTVTSTGEIY